MSGRHVPSLLSAQTERRPESDAHECAEADSRTAPTRERHRQESTTPCTETHDESPSSQGGTIHRPGLELAERIEAVTVVDENPQQSYVAPEQQLFRGRGQVDPQDGHDVHSSLVS